MPIIKLGGMVFEWHDPKYELVHGKRQISFEEVISVFADDFAIEVEDIGDYNEQRMIIVGMSNQHDFWRWFTPKEAIFLESSRHTFPATHR